MKKTIPLEIRENSLRSGLVSVGSNNTRFKRYKTIRFRSDKIFYNYFNHAMQIIDKQNKSVFNFTCANSCSNRCLNSLLTFRPMK